MTEVLPGKVYASDIDAELIAFWKAIQDGWEPPDEVTEDDYKEVKANPDQYDDATVWFVSVPCSFGAKKWDGYARNSKGHNYAESGRRAALKTRPNLTDVTFEVRSYLDVTPANALIYADPPYMNTTGYKGTDPLDYNVFWGWVFDRADDGCTVFVSEYSAPEGLEPVWSKDTATTFSSQVAGEGTGKKRTERLYHVKPYQTRPESIVADPTPIIDTSDIVERSRRIKRQEAKLMTDVSAPPVPPMEEFDRVMVTTSGQVDDIVAMLESGSPISFDVETTGLDPDGGDFLVGLAIAGTRPGDKAYYIPVAHGLGSFTDEDEEPDCSRATNRWKGWNTERYYALAVRDDASRFNVPEAWLDRIKEVWTAPSEHVAHNAQFDLTFLHKAGFPTPSVVYDTMIGAHVLFSDWRNAYFTMPDTGQTEQGKKALKWLARLFKLNVTKSTSGHTGTEQDLHTGINYVYDLMKREADGSILGLNDKAHLWSVPPQYVATYACQDVEITRALHKRLLELLDKWDNVGLYRDICDAQLHVAWRMSRTGFWVDTDRALEMMQDGTQQMNQLAHDAQVIVGDPNFNIGSPAQVRDYLNSHKGVKVANADKKVLAEYADRFPLLDLVSEYRQTAKMLKTYIVKWGDVATRNSGKINPSFNPGFVKTGRWSSSSQTVGNLQNIPADVHMALSPKMLLLPVPGNQLVESDYSGLELHIGAYIAETLVGDGADMTMTNLLISGADMHTYTMEQVGIPSLFLGGRDVTPDNVSEWFSAVKGIDPEAEFKAESDMMSDYISRCRHAGKTTNFACQYGGGWLPVSQILGLDQRTAQAIVGGWREAYPAIPAAMDFLARLADKRRSAPRNDDGGLFRYITYPIFGFTRKYDYYPTESENRQGGRWNPRRNEQRNAFSSVTQGTAGLICTTSATEISRRYPVGQGDMALHATVHDSIVWSQAPEAVDETMDVVEGIMIDWDVYPPLQVDHEVSPVGEAWGAKK